jgi:RNA polymerase sigma factor for flagellar operon FliA
MGLIKAVDQFDIHRGVKFETYAIALIRGAILEMMRDQDWVPRSVRDHIKSIDRAMTACELELGRPPADAEIAKRMDISLDQYHRLLSDTGRTTVVSLDEILIGSDDGDGVHLGDALADDSCNTLSSVERGERRARLAAAIRKLPPRERTVICLYYKDGLTFREIGQVLVISESRAFQLHSQAVTRMRRELAEHATIF